MSQLDQAKKEAKRLFNLAKANQENNTTTSISVLNNSITIDNLSKAKEILSLINGYKSWHEYEEVLRRKDFMFDKVDKATLNKENKEIFNNQKYYIQDIGFNTIINPTLPQTALVVEKEHKKIIMGRVKEKKLFETQEKKWLINQYPMLITGSTGAGKTETLLSMASQYIENQEGLIYIDGKCDNVIYSKIFSYASKYNRLNDLFCLNFMTGNRDVFGEMNNNNPEVVSHSIDPINPMLGSEEYFNNFFGRFGVIIHSILKELHQKNQLMDIQSLESIIMLNNLITWNKDKTFQNKEITEYLIEIGLSLEDNNDEEDFNEALLKHATLANTAYETISLFKTYSYLFRLDCSINMEKIFLERKILLVLLPALEKSTMILSKLGTLITSQIKHIEEKYQKYNTHFQNLIIDEFTYFADNLKTLNLNWSKNNYIFGCMDYGNNEIFNYVLNNVKTHTIMKICDSNLHNKIKLDLINNLEDFPKIKYRDKKVSFIKNFSDELRELREGQAYILSKNVEKNNEDIINNEVKYYCQYITCEYIPAKKEKQIWLVKHSKPIFYIQKT